MNTSPHARAWCRPVTGWLAWLLLLALGLGLGQSLHAQAPALTCQPAAITLGPDGAYTLTLADTTALVAAAHSDNGLVSTNVNPSRFTMCDAGAVPVTVMVTDVDGYSASCVATLTVNRPAAAPAVVYVDDDYGTACAAVTFPASGGSGECFIGFNAFKRIQDAVTSVAAGGQVLVAAGDYLENVTILKPVTVTGPNAGKSGVDPSRSAEAVVRPTINDPEDIPVFSVEADDVTLEGLTIDGHNPALGVGYEAGGVQVHAAAAVQNGPFYALVEVDRVVIRDNILRHVSYDGIYLEAPLGQPSDGNYLVGNRFETMWEGVQTYAMHAVIASNTFVDCNLGLSVHGTITPTADGFTPVIAGNQITLSSWWPLKDLPDRDRAQGIWVNYRRGDAAPLAVTENIIHTPFAAPAGKTVRGIVVTTVDGGGRVALVDNALDGHGFCDTGIRVAHCPVAGAVTLSGGNVTGVNRAGVLATTEDPRWGIGDARITVSNLSVNMAARGSGVHVYQDPGTPTNRVRVDLAGQIHITGGTTGVKVEGALASATLRPSGGWISGNAVGVEVVAGKVLIEAANLAGNSQAGIRARQNAIVDAGDCGGANATGLGTGTGLNGSSAGWNVLSDYGFDGLAPFAIENLNTDTVLHADNNHFKAKLGDAISGSLIQTSRIVFSQAGSLLVTCPPALTIACPGSIPDGAADLADFQALGGIVSCDPATVSFQDTPHPSGTGVVVRTYRIESLCGTSAECAQTISVVDDAAPLVTCPGSVVRFVPPGTAGAAVTFGEPTVSDLCGNAEFRVDPPSGSVFPSGTNTVTVTAWDAAWNTNTSTFTVAVVVVDPMPSLRVLARTNEVAAVSVEGYAGLPVVLQGSENLVDWLNLRTNALPFVHLEATAVRARFYRAVQAP